VPCGWGSETVCFSCSCLQILFLFIC